MTDQHRHPVNRQLLDQAPIGARIADRVTAFLGSWRFIVLQTVIVLIWIAVNVYHLLNATFDPFPFILLNLAFSTQAAYAAPLILLAGNRTTLRDRLTLEHAAAETDLAERQNAELLAADREILERVDEVLRRLERLERRGPGQSQQA